VQPSVMVRLFTIIINEMQCACPVGIALFFGTFVTAFGMTGLDAKCAAALSFREERGILSCVSERYGWLLQAGQCALSHALLL
jgi:hypothetical protein